MTRRVWEAQRERPATAPYPVRRQEPGSICPDLPAAMETWDHVDPCHTRRA